VAFGKNKIFKKFIKEKFELFSGRKKRDY